MHRKLKQETKQLGEILDYVFRQLKSFYFKRFFVCWKLIFMYLPLSRFVVNNMSRIWNVRSAKREANSTQIEAWRWGIWIAYEKKTARVSSIRNLRNGNQTSIYLDALTVFIKIPGWSPNSMALAGKFQLICLENFRISKVYFSLISRNRTVFPVPRRAGQVNLITR